MELNFRTFLWLILLSTMVGCFMAQMWEQFVKYLKGQTTVAVSFEYRDKHKFPSFAFCDSRAYKTRIPFAATEATYNASTFDVESEVEFHGICEADYHCGVTSNHTG